MSVVRMTTATRDLFQNLIHNAIKFRSADAPRIIIQTHELDHSFEFSVKDNGIGIPEHQQDHIFKMFKRLHGQQEIQGTGIGLALCKKIVDKHHGRIWVESQEEDGANFRIAWPLKYTLPKKKKKKSLEQEF